MDLRAVGSWRISSVTRGLPCTERHSVRKWPRDQATIIVPGLDSTQRVGPSPAFENAGRSRTRSGLLRVVVGLFDH